LAEVAAIAYVDICKACTYVYDLETAALKQIIPEIESELKVFTT
jgi:neurofibromin 1